MTVDLARRVDAERPLDPAPLRWALCQAAGQFDQLLRWLRCSIHTPVFARGFYNPLCCLVHPRICVYKGRRICHVTSLIEMSCSESSMSISSLCRRAEIFIYPVSALIRLGSMEETGSRPVYVDRVMTMTRTHAPTKSGNSWRICKLAMTSRPD